MAGSTAADLLAEGLTLHRRGALAEAAARYDAALQVDPHNADAHYYLGMLACQQRRFAEGAEAARRSVAENPAHARAHVLLGRALTALGRHDEALASFDRALALIPDFAEAHGHRADVLSDLGRYSEAIEAYDRALALAPDRAENWFNRGVALKPLHHRDQAIASLSKAIAGKPDFPQALLLRAALLTELDRHKEALQSADAAIAIAPKSAEAWLVRGKACLALGNADLALEAAIRSLQNGETAQGKAFFVDALKLAKPPPDGPLRGFLQRALSEGWARPHELIGASIAILTRDPPLSECIRRANAAWPGRLPAKDLLGPEVVAALARDQLLCRALEAAPVTEVGLERLLTNLRHAMLTAGKSDEATSENLLILCCTLARQCFINEYVFSLTDAEAGQAALLCVSLETALAAGENCPAMLPALVASYFPLHTLANAHALLERSWSQCVAVLLVQQIQEPLAERQLAATIPGLTEIDAGVSTSVRQQYEQNPYPRWTKAGPPALPPVLAELPPDQAVDILVAGCGTGLVTIELARARPQARILAIDLSLASLSYAKRMAQPFALGNVEFAQADIMKLFANERRFDFIDASGVLHHLADPWQGWRVLLSLLRPGGAMQVGLYSAAARRNVVAVRDLIGQRGYEPTPADIRRCHEEILATPDGSLLKSVVAWADFFSLSACRDLLFHIQEHRMTLPEIKAFLADNGLQFTGFILPPTVISQFRARFPERAAIADLDCWHAFECDAPQTFAGMYQFGVRKSGVTTRQ